MLQRGNRWVVRQPSAGEGHLLLQAARRAVRAPRPLVAAVARMSALPPPAPRPHHVRIARAILQDTASRFEGQVFALGNGDFVLLCSANDTGDPSSKGAPPPPALPAVLGRLFAADLRTLAPDDLVTLWPLPDSASALLAYAQEHAGEVPAALPDPPPPPGPATRVEQLAGATDSVRVADLLQRRTAVLVGAGMGGPPQALFREISFSIAALEGQVGPGSSAEEDPYLFRHLAARLDRKMLDLVAGALGHGGPLDPCARSAPAIHLNLTLATASSPALEVLVGRIQRGGGQPPGAEISLLEAAADPLAFAAASAKLRGLGCTVAVDGVALAALPMLDLSVLPAALIKLAWAPNLPQWPAQDGGRVDTALGRLDPARLLLVRADTEAAMRWGLERGIQRFQGAHVDAMLASNRLGACRHGRGCTLRQCRERHTAVCDAARVGCLDHGLLDAAASMEPGRPPSRNRSRRSA